MTNFLDRFDYKILETLASNGRTSLKQLAARIGLSAPSTSERLKRLEERGVIKSYGIDIDPHALGLTLQAIVRVRPLPGRTAAVQRTITDLSELVECDKVTGDDCFVLRLWARSLEHLDQTVDRIAQDAAINTAIVKTTIVQRRNPRIG